METIRELSHVPERNEHPEGKSACGKWLQALGHCINKPIVFKGIKIMGFTALLILVFLVYGFDIYTKKQCAKKCKYPGCLGFDYKTTAGTDGTKGCRLYADVSHPRSDYGTALRKFCIRTPNAGNKITSAYYKF